jgi:hypothetical protein
VKKNWELGVTNDEEKQEVDAADQTRRRKQAIRAATSLTDRSSLEALEQPGLRKYDFVWLE